MICNCTSSSPTTDAAPARHHIGLTIDDFDAAYEAVSTHASAEWGAELVELPSGQVQLYFRDPAGNLIELNWHDAGTLDRSRYPNLEPARPTTCPQTAESRPGRSLPGARAMSEVALGRPKGISERARALCRASPHAPDRGLVLLGRRCLGPGALGALSRADDGEMGDRVRLRGPRSEGLPDHDPERGHRGGALLRRGERIHADLRPHAGRQHGARRVLPARRLHRAEAPTPHGGRGWLVRAHRARRSTSHTGSCPTIVATLVDRSTGRS